VLLLLDFQFDGSPDSFFDRKRFADGSIDSMKQLKAGIKENDWL
jgi:hypothetical protein